MEHPHKVWVGATEDVGGLVERIKPAEKGVDFDFRKVPSMDGDAFALFGVGCVVM